MIKIAFFWTADFSESILRDLYKYSDIKIVFIVSQVDKKVGRKQVLTPTKVKQFALDHDIVCYQPESLKDDTKLHQEAKKLDFIVVVAYGKIMPIRLLKSPKYGSVNLHGSLLPSYRWASPVQESLKNGDSILWLSTMFMSAWMDEWDILLQKQIEYNVHNTALQVFQKYASIWWELLHKTLLWVIDWSMTWTPQDESKVSYCKKIQKTDGEIDFHTMSGEQIYNLYKAYFIWPWIYSFYNWKKLNFITCDYIKNVEKSKIGKVFQYNDDICAVQCQWWILVLHDIKLEWKKSITILDFINGNRDFIWHTF